MYNSRRDRRRNVQIEILEIRQMLAADYLYSLTPRAGVPDSGFGFSHAANEQFHVVSNFAYQETFHRLTEAPDYESFFYGEIQIHDATTGDLLRTIQNPLPYGHGGFGNYGEFNFALIAPNSFGYSIDIHDNLILVGSPGWEGEFDIPPAQGDHDTGGRAFLFDANTGNLLHTFDGSYFPQAPGGDPGQSLGGLNNDGFGRSVSIDGNRIAIGAHGPSYEDGEEQIHDIDPGRAYVYNATTGNLITIIESPYASPVETINFGATVSLSDGKLVVTEAGEPLVALSLPGPTRVYDAETGGLLHTLSANGNHQAVIKGNDIAVGVGGTYTGLFNATSGAITQTFAAQLYDFDGNLIVSGPASGDLTTFLAIRDFPSGNILYSVPQPPDFVEAYWEYNQIPQVFENRLLVPGRQGAANESVVFVYSVTDGPNNSPPSDIALSNDSVLENSANETVVGALTATDPTPNETLTFSLVNSASGRFAVNGTNLVVANGSLLNFEANDSHSLTVRVTDSANNTYDEAFTINVTDVNEAATVISINPAFESENTTNGEVVGSLFSNDFDAADPETFELLDGAGGRFEQVGLEIRVADASLLDFETASSHQINVRVTDSVGHVLEQLVSINIVDFNYAPTDILLSDNSVDEASITVLRNSSANRPNGFGARIASTDSRLLVAHRSVSPTETYNGWVYLYDAANQNLLATLSNPSGVPGDRFGQGIAIAGNYAVVGAGGEDATAEDSGRAYVYNATTGSLLHVLDNPDQTATSVDDEFGSAVSISGTVIAIRSNRNVTAPSGGLALFAGAVHLFDAVSGSLLTTILYPDPVHNGNFGGSISMAGNRILIGASGNGVGIQSGLAYRYQYNSVSATATYLSTLVNPTPGSFDNFGLTVAATSSVLAVAAPRDNTGAAESGLVYLFNATTGALLHTLQNPSVESGDVFGISLAARGDLVIIGARDNTGGAASGQSYVFSATTGTLLATIRNPTPAAGDLFGVGGGGGVAVNSTHVIVGATGDDAYVLTYSSTVPATGTVTVTVSTNGGPVTTIGSYPMTQTMLIDGLSGTDSVLVVGTTGSDTFTVLTNGWSIARS